MSSCVLSDVILDYISQSEFCELVCEPSFEEERKSFKVCEDLSALAEFGF
jgi:hypothetical protein